MDTLGTRCSTNTLLRHSYESRRPQSFFLDCWRATQRSTTDLTCDKKVHNSPQQLGVISAKTFCPHNIISLQSSQSGHHCVWIRILQHPAMDAKEEPVLCHIKDGWPRMLSHRHRGGGGFKMGIYSLSLFEETKKKAPPANKSWFIWMYLCNERLTFRDYVKSHNTRGCRLELFAHSPVTIFRGD